MQQKGFTLIELIIVIVILGILAVTAAPRFINLSSDATAATLQGVKAALQSGGQLVYAKAAIAGVQNQADSASPAPSVSVSGSTVSTDFGYPDASAASLSPGADFVGNWVQIDFAVDFDLTVGSGTADSSSPAADSFAISPAGGATDFSAGATSGRCYVLYTNAANANSAPVIQVADDDC